MQREILESDWKLLSRLKPIALDRFCRRILSEIDAIVSGTRSAHERYLAVFAVMEKRDRELAECFNGLRRSNALLGLVTMRSLGLLSDEEFAGFSPETQSVVDALSR